MSISYNSNIEIDLLYFDPVEILNELALDDIATYASDSEYILARLDHRPLRQALKNDMHDFMQGFERGFLEDIFRKLGLESQPPETIPTDKLFAEIARRLDKALALQGEQ